MPSEVNISLGLVFGFALTLLRFAGMFVFLPWPGVQAGPSVARVVFAVGCTLALQSKWPRIDGVPPISQLVAWAAGEAALGMLVGLATAWLSEIFIIGAQALSVQAGYSFASTFDPNTQADSGILQIFAQLAAGLLFFTTGMDGHVLRLLAASLDTCPPGAFVLSPSMAHTIIRLGGEVFGLAVRLALPVIGLLFLVDLVMGVVGRVNAQMQMISLLKVGIAGYAFFRFFEEFVRNNQVFALGLTGQQLACVVMFVLVVIYFVQKSRTVKVVDMQADLA